MVGTAAHEGEPILDPVRQPEAEHAAIVFDEFLGLRDAERQMAELERADAGDRLVLGDRGLFGEHVDLGPLRVLERHRLRNARRGVVAGFATHSFGFETLADVAELGVRIDLEGELGAARLIALIELHHEIADLGRQMGPAVLPRRDRKPHDLGEIIDLPLEIGRLEGGVAEPFSLDHCCLRLGRPIGAGLWVNDDRGRDGVVSTHGRDCSAGIAIRCRHHRRPKSSPAPATPFLENAGRRDRRRPAGRRGGTASACPPGRSRVWSRCRQAGSFRPEDCNGCT